MAKQAIPELDPARFVREFLEGAVVPERLHQPARTTNRFALMRIEEYRQHIRFPIPVARTTVYDFFLITGGSLLGTDGLRTYHVGKNSLLLRAAGTIVGVDECAPDTTGYYGLFDADYVLFNLKNQNSVRELPFFGPDARPVLSLADPDAEELSRQLAAIASQLAREQANQQLHLSTLLYAFLLNVARLYGEPDPVATPSSAVALTTRFQNLLKVHALSQRAVHDYADRLAVTPNHLNRCVKDVTGRPASRWITDALLLEAKVLLRQTNLSIAEIAVQLSMDDVSYFARLFKKHTGQSPSAYRDQAA